MSTHVEQTLQQIAGWPVEDQLELLERAWDRLVDAGWQPALTDEFKAELDRRIAAADANPGSGMTIDQLLEHVRRAR